MVDIRQYESGDEKQILELFKEVFEKDRSIKHWKWQFLENPAEKPIIVLAEDKSQIIGQCTLLPTKMIVKNEEILAGQSIDTMLSKAYRGQGLHKVLAQKTFEIAKDKNIKFRIGFPSQDALRGLLGGIGGTLVTEINLYMKVYKLDGVITPILKVKPLAKILSAIGMFFINLSSVFKAKKAQKNYFIKEIEAFDEEFDILSDTLKKESYIMATRDSDFLNWRIANNQEFKYKTFAAYCGENLSGYIVLKIEDRKIRRKFETKLGSIVDIVGIDEDVILALSTEADKYFRENKVDFAVTWITKSMKYKALLMKSGFRKSRSTIPFVVKSLEKNEALDKFITQEKNWYLMPIESDFY